MRRIKDVIHRAEPHVVDRLTLVVISAVFGVGVFVLGWQSHTMRLEVDAANVAWMVLVSFGMAWHAGLGSGWRVGAGMVFGVVAAIGGYYGSIDLLPVTTLGVGIGLGLVAAVTAAVCHVLQRVVSFAAVSVGFGIGIAASLALPLRPTTAVEDVLTLTFASGLAVVIGACGSLALRTFLLKLGQGLPHGTRLKPIDPVELFQEMEKTVARQPNGNSGRAAAKGAR